jgi:hypothetical protein
MAASRAEDPAEQPLIQVKHAFDDKAHQRVRSLPLSHEPQELP